MRRWFIISGIILLLGAALYERPPTAAPETSSIKVPELTPNRTTLSPPAADSGFLDNINLSLEPADRSNALDPSRAKINFQRDLSTASTANLHARPDNNATRLQLTMENQELNLEVPVTKDFAFKLNFKPVYSQPDSLIPARVDPTFGVSVKF